MHKTITQEQLKEMFTYKDGKLFWKVKKAWKTKIGEEAGSLNERGYCNISIDHKKYKAHRLIFLMHHGYLPEYIDHIDGNPGNNRLENLRECTTAQNQWNQKVSSKSTSGIKGVVWHKRVNQWQARVCVSGVRHYLGYFRSPELAERAVKDFREQQHGDFVNHGKQ
jgi:hypothetical protein